MGGGPAGCFAALQLLKDKPKWQVILIDRRGPRTGSPRGCAYCAGVLSPEVTDGLERFGLFLPEELIISRLSSIRWFMPGVSPVVYRPGGEPLLTVSRGGLKGVLSFDHWLLNNVAQTGAEVIDATVSRIDRKKNGWDVELEGGRELTADRVILASGLNGPRVTGHWDRTVHYIPPRTGRAIQAEVRFSPSVRNDEVLVFMAFHPGLDFVALTPKDAGRGTLTGIGKNTSKVSVKDLIDTPPLRNYLGTNTGIECVCRPRYVQTGGRVGGVHGLFVAGDLLATRFYKNGIGSAYFTGSAAAVALMGNHGQRYLDAVYRRFRWDNRIARKLFLACKIVGKYPWLNRALRRSYLRNRFGPMTWAIFLGVEPYSRIAWRAFFRGWP